MEDDNNIFFSHMQKQISDPNFRASQRALDRMKSILHILRAPKVNRPALEALCFHGIPDECNSLRPICWRILLGYLPENSAKWQSGLEGHRKNYNQYLEDYYTRLIAALKARYIRKKEEKAARLAAKRAAEENKETESAKKNDDQYEEETKPVKEQEPYPGFSRDDELWDDIVKDTKRTRSEMDFFQRETDFTYNNIVSANEEDSPETHNDVLARILFVYAKLNPGVSYVQGMNEILAPIYHSFSADQGPAFKNQAEPDSFFCFSLLMGEVQDAFIKGLDHTDVGIQARMLSLNTLLKRVDYPVWDFLERFSVNPQFYSLRWLMLLLTQEFELTEVVRLWDSLLSHPQKIVYLNYICLAMIELIRDRILQTDDFADLIEMLQKQTNGDLDAILLEAGKLYKAHAKPEERVYHIAFSS